MMNSNTQFCLLTEILKDMDVPEMRRELTKANLRWLGRNLSIRNGKHTNYPQARRLIVELLKQEESNERTN